jgi:hypothetical protein
MALAAPRLQKRPSATHHVSFNWNYDAISRHSSRLDALIEVVVTATAGPHGAPDRFQSRTELALFPNVGQVVGSRSWTTIDIVKT